MRASMNARGEAGIAMVYGRAGQLSYTHPPPPTIYLTTRCLDASCDPEDDSYHHSAHRCPTLTQP